MKIKFTNYDKQVDHVFELRYMPVSCFCDFRHWIFYFYNMITLKDVRFAILGISFFYYKCDFVITDDFKYEIKLATTFRQRMKFMLSSLW